MGLLYFLSKYSCVLTDIYFIYLIIIFYVYVIIIIIIINVTHPVFIMSCQQSLIVCESQYLGICLFVKTNFNTLGPFVTGFDELG